MDKTYIGTIELNNGSVIVGNALFPDSTVEICPIYKGVYHCYQYKDNISRTHVGIEYGGTLETPEFEQVGIVNVANVGGIFETVYYKVQQGEKLTDKWVEKVADVAQGDTPFNVKDNRAIFVNTFNKENQGVYIFKQVDSRNFCVGIEFTYMEGERVKEEPETTYGTESVACDAEAVNMFMCNGELSFQETPDEETRQEYTEACLDDPDRTEIETFEGSTCAECNQTFWGGKEIRCEDKGTDIKGVEANEHIVQTLYYDFTNKEISDIVQPRMNNIIKDLLNGGNPPSLWYRGMTVEKINGKIHKLTFDFD